MARWRRRSSRLKPCAILVRLCRRRMRGAVAAGGAGTARRLHANFPHVRAGRALAAAAVRLAPRGVVLATATAAGAGVANGDCKILHATREPCACPRPRIRAIDFCTAAVSAVVHLAAVVAARAVTGAAAAARLRFMVRQRVPCA
jgi:hypothetical protein